MSRARGHCIMFLYLRTSFLPLYKYVSGVKHYTRGLDATLYVANKTLTLEVSTLPRGNDLPSLHNYGDTERTSIVVGPQRFHNGMRLLFSATKACEDRLFPLTITAIKTALLSSSEIMRGYEEERQGAVGLWPIKRLHCTSMEGQKGQRLMSV